MLAAAGDIRFLGSFTQTLPEVDLPEVAFVGRSNVGKSSAINALLNNHKAARVSRTPGRTQAINLFRLGDALVFADLPGYGYAKVPKAIHAGWKPLIEGYLGDRQRLVLVVVFVDSRLEAQDLDLGLIEGLDDAGVPFVVVATKVDKLRKAERKPTLGRLAEGLGDPRLLPFSAHTGEGVADVWALIEAACRGADARPGR